MASGHYEYQSDFARKYVAEGRAAGIAEGLAEGHSEGKAEALLTILAARGLAVSEEQRQRILACRDLASLDRWIARAATAASIEQALD
jgi:flagellar biosynthesis/type III secretory pathway protein FliH